MERNRYILGLSERLVVIEAGVRGGTLAAGREAIDAGMETWVLDYPDPPESAAGNRLLLEMGARAIPLSADGELAISPEVYALGDWVVIEIRNPTGM
jgi:DNA processing protein